MRLTRRALLGAGALVGAAGALAGHRALASRPEIPSGLEAVPVRAYPLDGFSIRERDRRRFGQLEFRSGLELQSEAARFGGFSGLWRSPDGGSLVALTDDAQWLTARVATRDGRLVGLEDARMAPILGPDGAPLRGSRRFDTEALTIAEGEAFVTIERAHALVRFDWQGEGVRSRGQFLELPSEAMDLPRNKGLEAIGVAPRESPLAGALVAVAERARWEDEAPTLGFVLTGGAQGSFGIARSGGFEATDLVFAPGGDLLLLERRFSVARGVGCRIRRLEGTPIRPGALIDGPTIFEADDGHQIDNMEGIALHRGDQGEMVLTLISDNNFSMLQRTLLLEFALVED